MGLYQIFHIMNLVKEHPVDHIHIWDLHFQGSKEREVIIPRFRRDLQRCDNQSLLSRFCLDDELGRPPPNLLSMLASRECRLKFTGWLFSRDFKEITVVRNTKWSFLDFGEISNDVTINCY
ncbi:hypothetical protein Y032_0665g1325 [Ancylostoma ceylanicum]|uniref:Uncharacterized protein n=1 Tax=Ancylostoma ceylanicum TaxID=53326 RepID=A0A016WJR8_9BILA|nr:hypothetical protein Y032_0665g1325 [Ancylostoma ceylanicum]